MKLFSISSFLAFALSASAAPVLVESGDLETLILGLSIPSAASLDKYQLPTQAQMDAFRAALGYILEGDLPSAADEAEAANYDLVSYTDTVSSDVYALLREKNSNQHWGGFYAVDMSPERALVVQCPHPRYDGVWEPSVDIFMQTDAVAFLLAGTHRNNSPDESLCDGTLGGDPYRISDMAHAPESLFQAAHEVIEAHYERSISLSFHGMADSSDPADVVISNGTPDEFVGNSLSRDLAARMNQILSDAADSRVVVSHQEPGENPSLSGSTNTQGRVTNGSTEPCMTAAPGAIFPERFIHMETDQDVKDPPESNWAFIITTLNELIPLFSDANPDLPHGDLVVSEIMMNPDQVGDATGEFIELFNHTGAAIDMTGWVIGDAGGNAATYSGVIQSGELFVVGVSGDLNGGGEPGGEPDTVWADTIDDLTLTNTGDTISVINANGDLVASVSYDDDTPLPIGVSLELTVLNIHPNGQTVRSDYVESVTPFGTDFASVDALGSSTMPLGVIPLHVVQVGADLQISFAAAPAVTYELMECSDLPLNSWTAVPGQSLIIGDGSEADFTVPIPITPMHFYRLEYSYPLSP